jgi:hypothetical protein
MSLIDWSDPEEMLGLLVEYVADEAIVSAGDPERAAWLGDLRDELRSLAMGEVDAVDELAEALREIRGSLPREGAADPVVDHLDACIEELQRIEKSSQPGVAGDV